MHLVCDVDDVLLNWMDGFKAFLDNKGVPRQPGNPKDWDMTTWLNGVEYVPFIEEFNSSPAFGELKPVENAVEALGSLFNYGASIFLVTSCTENASSIKMREENLYEHFGEIFEEVNCLPLGASKSDILKRYKRGAHYIEDNHGHAVRGLREGMKPIILDRDHNMHLEHPEVIRCSNWDEIYKIILEDYAKIQEVK